MRGYLARSAAGPRTFSTAGYAGAKSEGRCADDEPIGAVCSFCYHVYLDCRSVDFSFAGRNSHCRDNRPARPWAGKTNEAVLMRSKFYPCDESREWYEWEARWWDEQKLIRHGDLDEIRNEEYERKRIARENELCGYVPQEDDNE